MSKRGSIFDTDETELDVSSFIPKTAPEPKASIDQVRAIAEASHFPSREAKPASPSEPAKRKPRLHRTGRTAQFNVRVKPAYVADYYAIADEQGWLVGETAERALDALKRELGKA